MHQRRVGTARLQHVDDGIELFVVHDHLGGDILRLRKQHMWRTAMVLQELEREIGVSDRLEAQISDLQLLDRRRRNLESEIDYQALRLKKIKALLEDTSLNAIARGRLDEARKQTKPILDSLRDRAALILVYEADRARDANHSDRALAAYERTIKLFPTTYWADVARQRLKEMST